MTATEGHASTTDKIPKMRTPSLALLNLEKVRTWIVHDFSQGDCFPTSESISPKKSCPLEPYFGMLHGPGNPHYIIIFDSTSLLIPRMMHPISFSSSPISMQNFYPTLSPHNRTTLYIHTMHIYIHIICG